MKQIVTLAILLILFVGFAGATNPVPTYNAGHPGGDKFPGVVEASYGTIDNDLYVGGAANIVGTVTTGATVTSGTIGAAANMGAGLDFGAVAGDGIFDWHLATGTFDTSTGLNTWNGNTVISGSKTFTSGTGAVSLLGSTTLATGKTFAAVDADSITENGVIVPQYPTFPVEISASSVNRTVFMPISGNIQVVGIQEVHAVAGTDGHAVTATIVKVTGTQDPASAGVLVMSNTFNLKGTPNTIQTAVLTGANNCKCNLTERLGIRFNNPLTSLAGCDLAISYKRIP